jgi:hypothetical protein
MCPPAGKKISLVGGYGKKGDNVRVEGVFHRACPEHGGDLDIHAGSVTVLSTGARVAMPLSRLVTTLAIALPIPAAFCCFSFGNGVPLSVCRSKIPSPATVKSDLLCVEANVDRPEVPV